jgi:type II secretory pathway pseudopilin PulG
MPKVKARKGFILIASYLVIVILIILGAAFIAKSVNEAKIAEREKRFLQAFYISEGGIEGARDQLNQNWNNRSSLTDVPLGAGTYTADISDKDRLGDDLPLDELRITSKGSVGDISRTIEVILKSIGNGSAVVSAIETEGILDIHGNITINGGQREVVNTSVDDVVSAGASSIVVVATDNFVVGDTIVIDADGGSEEQARISNIDPGTLTITVESPLTYGHALTESIDRILVFEDIFTLSKTEMKALAQSLYPSTYYNRAFTDADTATQITWVESPSTESQITASGWSGNGLFIVHGDLKVTGGVFDGVLWVDGALQVSGNPTFNGGLFVESGVTVDTEITGTATINYDTDDISDAFLNLLPVIESWEEL